MRALLAGERVPEFGGDQPQEDGANRPQEVFGRQPENLEAAENVPARSKRSNHLGRRGQPSAQKVGTATQNNPAKKLASRRSAVATEDYTMPPELAKQVVSVAL
jgi:hypothetical protein